MSALVFIIPLGFVLAATFGLIRRFGERWFLKRGTVIAEYEAPHLLSPAELGYLVDKDFGDNELLATALTLVNKEFIDLIKHEADNPLLIARDDIKDLRLKVLNDGELAVWSWIRSQKLGTVPWKDISDLFSSTLGARASFEQEVKNLLISKGYLLESSPFSFKNISTSMYYASAVILFLVVAGSYLLAVQTATTGLDDGFRIVDRDTGILAILIAGAIVWLPMVYLLRLIYLTYYYAANQPIGITDKFRRQWHDIAGFQLFIKTVEFSRLDADTNPYDGAMTYAIALGFKPDLDKMTDLAIKRVELSK